MDIEKKLDILYDLLVDNSEILEFELKELISNPERIKNTNKFASLLSDLKNTNLVDALLVKISESQKGDFWLTDFLYAAINLLEESNINDEFDIPPFLLDKFKIWILEENGELAWKAATILKFYETESAEQIQLKKLEERGDFFLTYAECILGLIHYDKEKHWELVKKISNDETYDIKLREFCDDVIKNYR
jgi:hypothetical protein